MFPPPRTPPIAPPWTDRYERIDTPQWAGWIDRTLVSAASRPWIDCPRDLMDKQSERWLKRGRNRSAEVRWPSPTPRAADAGAAAAPPPRTVFLKEFAPAGWIRTALCRPSRAARAWMRAFELLERGVATPRPLWLALPKRGGPVSPSFLAVGSAPPHQRLREILGQIRGGADRVELGEGHRLGAETFLSILARYVREMHDAGIWHRDFSGGNLLIPNDWRAAESPEEAARSARESFILIDINRSRLYPAPPGLSIGRRMQDLERVSLPPDRRESFYTVYAQGRPDLERARPLYLRRARLYRRLRETRDPALRLWRKVFTYWLRLS